MSLHCILIADDDTDNRRTFFDFLSPHYQIVEATNGIEAIEAARVHKPSLLLLDFQMPKVDGIDVCKMIRAIDDLKTMPIIMVSGSGDELTRTKAFLSGIDDFITKPVSSAELIARIKSKLNWVRQPASDESIQFISIGNLTIDDKKLIVAVNGQPTRLTHFEYTLLKYFIENKDCVLSRAKILEKVWNLNNVNTRTVDTHLYSLRQKLKDFDHEFETVHSAGYILKPRLIELEGK